MGLAIVVIIVFGFLFFWMVLLRWTARPKTTSRKQDDYVSEEQQLERAFNRIGDLEDRVARLEDPTGKRKRGGAIYAFDHQQAITGLLALQEALREKGYDAVPVDVAESLSYILGDDGELRKDMTHD